MADKNNQTSTDAITRKITNFLEQQQTDQAQQNKSLNQLVGLQQENNLQISGLTKSVNQLDQRVERNNLAWKQNRSK